MTGGCATHEPVTAPVSLRPARVRFVSVLVVQAALAVAAILSGTVSFGGVLPWRVIEWTMAGLVASVFVVKFSRVETGPVFAVADDLLPVLTLLALTLALATLAEGQSVLAIEAIGLGSWGIAVFAPRLRRQSPPAWVPHAARLSIAVANVFVDNPTPQRTAAELVHSGVDVIVVNELTDRFLQCVDELGGDVWFPHRIVDGGGDPEYVTAVFSRLPFGSGSCVMVLPGPLRVIRAHLDVDGTPLTLLATHLEANIERGGHPRWRAQLASLTGLASRSPSRTVIAGDLNSSIDRPPLDDLLEHGYTDAHVSLGRGLDASLKLAPKGPLAAFGAVARVDHLLMAGDVCAVEITRLRAPGSDHLPFAATLAVRRSTGDGPVDQPGTWNTSAPPR